MEARRDQEIEVEKFVEMEYTRQEEAQKPWPFSILSKPAPDDSSATASASSPPDYPFYKLKDFKLRFHEPLEFADSLYVSSNYFNPRWSGLRRLKNVVMVRLNFLVKKKY